jgi:hypothetical protein
MVEPRGYEIAEQATGTGCAKKYLKVRNRIVKEGDLIELPSGGCMYPMWATAITCGVRARSRSTRSGKAADGMAALQIGAAIV